MSDYATNYILHNQNKVFSNP